MNVIKEVLMDLSLAEQEGTGEYDYSLDGDRIILRPWAENGDLLPPIGHITYTPIKETP